MSTGQLAHIGRKLTKQDDGSIGTGVHCAEVRCCGAITNVWAEGQRAGDQTNESAAGTAAGPGVRHRVARPALRAVAAVGPAGTRVVGFVGFV